MFNVKDSVVAKEDIMTCRFEIVVRKGTLGTVLGKDEDEGLYLVVFDEGICGKKDPWWVKEHQIRLAKTVPRVPSLTTISNLQVIISSLATTLSFTLNILSSFLFINSL